MLEYKPHFIPSAIYVVGCGGTGSRLVPLLSQLVKTTLRSHNAQGWMENLPIFLIDDDTVEQKNLSRQNFIDQDVGQPKAVVLANRYSRGFGVAIYPGVFRIQPDSERQLMPAFLGRSSDTYIPVTNVILVMAVDSAEGRRTVLKWAFAKFTNMFVIDAGNEDSFGQVRFFTDTRLISNGYGVLEDIQKNFFKSFPKLNPVKYPVPYIPAPLLYYESLGSSVSEKSCADLNQTLAINSMMATLMCGILQNFLYIKPMNYHKIEYNLNGAVSTTFNSPENWFCHVVPYPGTTRSGMTTKYSQPAFTGGLLDLNATYRNNVVATLNKMGLIVDSYDGAVTPKPKPVPVTPVKVEAGSVVEEPKKKTTRKKTTPITPEIEEPIPVGAMVELTPLSLS